MILGNYTQLNANVGTNIGGFTNPYGWLKYSNVMGYYAGEAEVVGETDKSSFNNGYTPPYSWALAPKSGGIAAVNGLIGYNTFQSLNLAGGLNGQSALTGSGDITSATANILAFLVSDLVQSGSLNADIVGGLNAASSLAGSGDLTGALGSLVGILADLNGDGSLTGSIASAVQGVASMAGSGDLTGAIVGVVQMITAITGANTSSGGIIGVWDMGASLSGTSAVTSTLLAIANLVSVLVNTSELSITQGAIPTNIESDISSCSDLSPENLAAAVWNSIAASFNNAGTMGAKMNSAASAGDPWSTILPGGYADGEAGKILSQIQTLVDELHTIQGLNAATPSTTTPTNWDAGDIHIEITGDGVTETTMQRV